MNSYQNTLADAYRATCIAHLEATDGEPMPGASLVSNAMRDLWRAFVETFGGDEVSAVKAYHSE